MQQHSISYALPPPREHTATVRVCATVSALLGLAALAGRALQWPLLTGAVHGISAMNANSALSVLLCGIALAIMADDALPYLRKGAQMLCIAVALLGLATLAEYMFGWQLRVDELPFTAQVPVHDGFGGRMSPFSAATLVAIALALSAVPYRRLYRIAQCGAMFGLVAGSTSLLGYAWYLAANATDRWVPPMALNTAVCFVLLGTAVLLASAKRIAGPAEPVTQLASLELKILAGFMGTMSLLLVGSTYTYQTALQSVDTQQWAHGRAVRASLAALQEALAGAEITLRDFVLSSDLGQRERYVSCIAEVQRQLANLHEFTADDAAQQQNLAVLAPLVTERLAALRAALMAYTDQGPPAARALIALRPQTNPMTDVRGVIRRMGALEESVLAAYQGATKNDRRTTLISLLVALAVLGGLCTVLFRAMHLEMMARRDAENALRADINEVKRAERALLEANRSLDSLIENLPVMIMVKDAATLQLVRVNRACEQLLGYSREEMIGRTAHELFNAEEAGLSVASDREALDQGRLVELLEQQITTERLGVRAFHTMKMPVAEAGGKPRFLLAISVDITGRKLAEQAIRELNSALQTKAEQLTATNRELESFSYSVSHDLRAPLRAIDGFAQMLEEDYQARLDAEGRRFLAVIRNNSQRMADLIDNLLSFSRLGRLPVENQQINVESLVREVVDEALQAHGEALRGHRSEGFPPNIEIGPLPPTRGDRVLLRQVWANLIANAIKYSSRAPRPVIEVSGRQSASENLYSIRDNGVGFDMQYADKLFGIFQRLHRAEEFSGTGVGLAIVHRAVTKHGGRVWAEGSVNQGAVFFFALPQSPS